MYRSEKKNQIHISTFSCVGSDRDSIEMHNNTELASFDFFIFSWVCVLVLFSDIPNTFTSLTEQ